MARMTIDKFKSSRVLKGLLLLSKKDVYLCIIKQNLLTCSVVVMTTLYYFYQTFLLAEEDVVVKKFEVSQTL